jgi:hypothetical protein
MYRTRLILMGMLSLIVLTASSALAEPGDCRLIRGEATPDDATDDVSVCREDVWFHQAETKAGNLGATEHSGFPSWDPTAPATSVTGGAGGGYLAEWTGDFLVEEYFEETTPTFEGTFTGDLDNAAVTMYLFAAYEAPTDLSIRTQVVVDGVQLYSSDFTNGDSVTLTSGGDAVLRVDYVFTDLYDSMRAMGLHGEDREHDIRVSFTPLEDEALVVYDTTEVPSGIIFNAEPEALEAYTELEV